MTPCVFTDPVDVGSAQVKIILVTCTKHGTKAHAVAYSNRDQVVSAMHDRIEAHCFEKFMKAQMGTLKKENP